MFLYAPRHTFFSTKQITFHINELGLCWDHETVLTISEYPSFFYPGILFIYLSIVKQKTTWPCVIVCVRVCALFLLSFEGQGTPEMCFHVCVCACMRAFGVDVCGGGWMVGLLDMDPYCQLRLPVASD